MCARLCVCGTDVVVLCAGLPAGTEDVTAAAAAAPDHYEDEEAQPPSTFS